MAGLQGLLHSPIKEGTPEVIVAPSPIESATGSKFGTSGLAKQHRKAVNAGPAEIPRLSSHLRPSSKASTRPPTPLAIQSPTPKLPLPDLNALNNNAIVISSREPSQELLHPDPPSPGSVDDALGKEGGALNEEAVLKTLIKMTMGTNNISKMEAFDHLLTALKEAKERGTLHELKETPTTKDFTFQTSPIPSIPSPSDLRIDDGSSEQLHHDITRAINTLSNKLDQSLINQQFFMAQVIILTNTMFRIDSTVAAIATEQAKQSITDETNDAIDRNILDKLDLRTHKALTGLANTAQMVAEVGKKVENLKQRITTLASVTQPQPNSPPRFMVAEKGKGPANEMEAARIIYNKVAQVETTIETIAKQVSQIQTKQQSLWASVTPLSQRVSFGLDTPVQTPTQPPAPPSHPPTPKPRLAMPKPTPSTSNSTLQQTPKMKQGEQFFLNLLAKADPLQLLRWARVISWGK